MTHLQRRDYVLSSASTSAAILTISDWMSASPMAEEG